MEGVTSGSPLLTSEVLIKKARCKYMTNWLAGNLAEIATGYHRISYYDKGLKQMVHCSKRKKDVYLSPTHCCSTLEQKGDKFTAHYCNQRQCIVCSHIRTGKLINGYLPVISEWDDKAFVTLTVRNVKLSELEDTINLMNERIKRIKDDVQRREKLWFVGIRKLECTYNPITDEYHPHFHLIINNTPAGEKMIEYWCRRWGELALEKSQDIRKADNGSVKELFKYFTKMFIKVNDKKYLHRESLYNILEVMRGRRTFQPMGIKKVSEDVDEIAAQRYDVEHRETFWKWHDTDWYCELEGDGLTDFEPSEKLLSSLTLFQ